MSMDKPLPDFDALVALHQFDPEGFEDFRRHVLREAVECAPIRHRARLEALVAQLDKARSEAETPYDAARVASEMMQESARRLCDAWDEAHEAVAGMQARIVIDRIKEHRFC
ncbi:DUF3135 domain-containing protein [Noviherbaspirillum galbum]|uniref:DUF3135 domain-containing protein n=1 Tax=Noviherbaspirillum galbum TaxID=2709383 RepID=A0A6B3SU20_9BURK|nr:DUF3135 domain-containing protein [Noviherbaspirillum galbum]NEX64091.1 DUF3135 domain-containing protein [Noviherbaspirillum galbum]